MKSGIFFLLLSLLIFEHAFSQTIGSTLDLNGLWDFEQTADAFPPRKFTRKCPVPGLIHLARPKVEAYDKWFSIPEQSFSDRTSDYRVINYAPRYSWYRRTFNIPANLADTEIMLTINKSQYVTQVYVNGQDMGQSVACSTPIRKKITQALIPGKTNEILIRVGERIWLPPWAAGGTDKEKVYYIPGIWDDVFLSVSGKQKILKNLILPSVQHKSITTKIMVRSFYSQQADYGDPMLDDVRAEITIREKLSGNPVASAELKGKAVRDNETQLEVTFPFPEFTSWSPDNPFLYQAEIKLFDNEKLADVATSNFGMRDFERRGKFFFLNGEKYYLRGSNITLHRFFEDPDCGALPWDRKWVKKMLIEDPKSIGWNSMRICVGLVPKFWYDLADEHGMMFQNEWMYWQNHGWDQQIREEYTDWVWSDGNHPSIVIWDAINENRHAFIGNVLIPELQELDPTRIWDAGYMQTEHLKYEDPIDEPHLYRAGQGIQNSKDPATYLKNRPYLLGKMDDWEQRHRIYLDASAAQLVNEYGWNWLWRDGRGAKLTNNIYDFFLGKDATPSQRRELQAYWLQCETEWIRAERTMAGVLAFTHLTNNYGYTGDWYINNIKDLERSITFEWLEHAFTPANVFIDLADQRFFPNGHYQPGQRLPFNLVGINDLNKSVNGQLELIVLSADNRSVVNQSMEISIPAYGRVNHPVVLDLPDNGGYLVMTRFTREGESKGMMSRRYIRVGNEKNMVFPEIRPDQRLSMIPN